jgi:holliday junction DNA helicase RuvA
MFDYITGKLTKVSSDSATVEANGIGYRMYASTSCISRLPALASHVTLYVSFVVREFAHTLYGFLEEQERELFEALLNISGIGPKTALAIIGHMNVEELTDALIRKDTQALCRVPGIGKKTAERLLVELKDTLAKLSVQPIHPSSPKNSLSYDAVSALVNLGYSPLIAQKAVKKVLDIHAEPSDLPTLITLSLKNV